MNKFARLAIVAGLIFGANVASAIPLRVDVATLAAGGSAGQWSLTGTTPGAGSWVHIFAASQSWDLDIAPGEYDWSISGFGVGIPGGVVAWSLSLAGQVIYSDADAGFLKFRFNDDYSFSAIAVPEPATLGMFGLALSLLGIARSRRRQVA